VVSFTLRLLTPAERAHGNYWIGCWLGGFRKSFKRSWRETCKITFRITGMIPVAVLSKACMDGRHPLHHWDRGFRSRTKLGCMSAFSVLCCPV
jgi:hypothetical protein